MDAFFGVSPDGRYTLHPAPGGKVSVCETWTGRIHHVSAATIRHHPTGDDKPTPTASTRQSSGTSITSPSATNSSPSDAGFAGARDSDSYCASPEYEARAGADMTTAGEDSSGGGVGGRGGGAAGLSLARGGREGGEA